MDAPPSVSHVDLWFLLSMLGFYSEPHHDASGYATWVQILRGIKAWIILYVKGDRRKPASWLEYIDFQDRVSGMTAEEVIENFDAYILFLGPGSQLWVFSL